MKLCLKGFISETVTVAEGGVEKCNEVTKDKNNRCRIRLNARQLSCLMHLLETNEVYNRMFEETWNNFNAVIILVSWPHEMDLGRKS